LNVLEILGVCFVRRGISGNYRGESSLPEEEGDECSCGAGCYELDIRGLGQTDDV
jgi:hypothetical protein